MESAALHQEAASQPDFWIYACGLCLAGKPARGCMGPSL